MKTGFFLKKNMFGKGMVKESERTKCKNAIL